MKGCIRCGRKIDAYARICPYCNWDQTVPVPAQQPAGAAHQEPYVPPPDNRWHKPVIGAIGILIAVLIAGLAIGERLRDSGPQAAPPSEQQVEQLKLQQKEAAAAAAGQARPSPRANVTLVPDNGPAPSFDQPVTSAPTTTTAQGLDNAYQRTDATAASSAEYSLMAQRARAEKKKMDVLVDPRSVGGVAYEQSPPPRPTRRQTTAESTTNALLQPHAARTAPVPEYQPVPDLRVSENATARLELAIGADGLVKRVSVREAIPADMGRLIASVQSWRFKPATENGVPVPSPFTVELSFHARE